MNDLAQKTSITRSQWSVILGSLKAVALGAIAGTAIGLLAFSFLTSCQHPGKGSALFLLVPIAAGLPIAMVAREPNSTTTAAILLIAPGKEAVLCAVLLFPIIVLGLFMGIEVRVLARKLFISRTKNQTTTTVSRSTAALSTLRLSALLTLTFLNATILAHADTVRFSPVSQQVVESRLHRYVGNDSQRAETLKQMFAEAGCTGDHLTEQPVKGSKLANIICVLPGSGDHVIIVGAHYDHVPAGDGVVDNWSGASLLPSLYEAVKDNPRTHTYVFIGFTDEEKGEVGSHFYAKEMSKEQVATTDAMVNMDTLGLGPTEVWASHSDKRLVGALFSLAGQVKMPATAMNVERVGTTDSEQFVARKIPSITIHSLTQQTWDAGILHSSKDKLSAIRIDDYYTTYRLLSTYLAWVSAPHREQPHPSSH